MPLVSSDFLVEQVLEKSRKTLVDLETAVKCGGGGGGGGMCACGVAD